MAAAASTAVEETTAGRLSGKGMLMRSKTAFILTTGI